MVVDVSLQCRMVDGEVVVVIVGKILRKKQAIIFPHTRVFQMEIDGPLYNSHQ